MKNIFVAWLVLTTTNIAFAQSVVESNLLTWDEGAIVRGDTSEKKLSFVFTGDEYAEGLKKITNILKRENILASFFFTGRLYRNDKIKQSIIHLRSNGHYLGPHSDMHLLYNDWKRRDSTLVSKDSLIKDLKSNYNSMLSIGINERNLFFIPPYEWWNKEVADWLGEMNVRLINFTPGTGTNADYTFPEMGKSYKSSDVLSEKLFQYEELHSLNGAIILIHIGTDPRRKDKFYDRLPELIHYLKNKGYEFLRVDELLKK